MSRYPTHRDAIHANDGDLFSVPGSSHKMALSVLDGGPNDHGHPALIPQANVIQAACYGDMGREPAAPIEYGAILHVPGFGCLKVVKDRNNRDWPRLVPLDGDRFYARYAGGPGYLNWDIRDSVLDGQIVNWDTKQDAAVALFGRKQINNRAEAFAVAAYLSAKAQG